MDPLKSHETKRILSSPRLVPPHNAAEIEKVLYDSSRMDLAGIDSLATPSVALAFLGGIASFVSPCVLPLVPGYLSMMAGVAPDEESPGERGRWQRQIVVTSILFVLGFSLVFIGFGAAASTLGAVLRTHQRTLTAISGVLVVAMGLVISGIARIGPLHLTKRFHVSPSRFGPWTAPLLGAAFAFAWTPCIGPVLASVLMLAASTQTLSKGVGLLAVYSLGLAVPFFISGVAFARARQSFAWFRKHGRVVEFISGALLIIMGTLMLSGQFGALARAAMRLMTWLGISLPG